VVRAGAERADISATVDITTTAGELRHVLGEHSIDSSSELLLRRVVGADGRSRAWINGQTVPLQVLASVTGMLFEIHGRIPVAGTACNAARPG
jgi:DNA repair protein RecN (Recombination protein N)